MLLEVKNLKKYFPVGHKKLLRAVDDVTLSIEKGEDPRPGRRVRLRKVHARPHRHRPVRAHGRPDPL